MKRLLLSLLLLTFSLPSRAEEPIAFKTFKEWRGPRWFILGRWENSQKIKWLGQSSSQSAFSDSACRYRSTTRLERSTAGESLETLQYQNWIAIEVLPFEEQQITLRDIDQKKCEVQIPVTLEKLDGRPNPRLFLALKNNSFEGQTFSLWVDNGKSIKSYSIELLLGVETASYFDSLLGIQRRDFLFPVLQFRAEYNPFASFNNLGFLVNLQHSGLGVVQVAEDQVWSTAAELGAFWRGNRGLVSRYARPWKLWFKYHLHNFDDGRGDQMRAAGTRDFQAPLLGGEFWWRLTQKLHFMNQAEYGLSNRWAGMGSQSFWSAGAQLSYQSSRKLDLFFEGKYLVYKAVGSLDEKHAIGSLGFRFAF